MKKTIILLISTIIISCGYLNTKPKKVLRLEKFLNSFKQEFDKTYPNFSQNEILNKIALKKTNTKLKNEIQVELKNGILDDFPLRLEEIKDFPNGRYTARFTANYSKNNNRSILSNTNFDVIGLVTLGQVKKLKSYRYYKLKGRFKQFHEEDYKTYVDRYYTTPEIELSQNGDKFQLGIILYVVDEIIETEKI